MKNKGIKVNKTLDPKEFYTTYIDMLDWLYSDAETTLTNREKDVLVEFMLLEDKFKYNRFGTQARKKVQNKLEVSYSNLQRQLGVLKDKGYIYKDADGIDCLKETLNAMIGVDNLKLEFNFKIEDSDNNGNVV